MPGPIVCTEDIPAPCHHLPHPRADDKQNPREQANTPTHGLVQPPHFQAARIPRLCLLLRAEGPEPEVGPEPACTSPRAHPRARQLPVQSRSAWTGVWTRDPNTDLQDTQRGGLQRRPERTPHRGTEGHTYNRRLFFRVCISEKSGYSVMCG